MQSNLARTLILDSRVPNAGRYESGSISFAGGGYLLALARLVCQTGVTHVGGVQAGDVSSLFSARADHAW